MSSPYTKREVTSMLDTHNPIIKLRNWLLKAALTRWLTRTAGGPT
ncbi:hypothetical protein ACFFW8_10655 [Erwinia tracheiphila]|nr:hypothetical protein [Erwinia tracheiphila]